VRDRNEYSHSDRLDATLERSSGGRVESVGLQRREIKGAVRVSMLQQEETKVTEEMM
jgi:hypothetical protein